MRKLFKPYSLLFYLLVLILFFILGMIYAGITEAAKNQGLAGGAIVFGYGVISAITALPLSFFAAYKLPSNTVVVINKVFGILLLLLLGFFTWKFYTREKQDQVQEYREVPSKPTEPADHTSENGD